MCFMSRDAMMNDLLLDNGTCYIATAGIGVRHCIGFTIAGMVYQSLQGSVA